MKGKGDPAFEKRMKVLNLARTCFMIMDADDSGTLSRDEILTAVREDKRVLGFLRECKEAVLRDLLVPERLEASLEEMDADKSGEIDMEEWINAVTLSLNAEMEREKKLQEEAMEKLAEVLEGEDLDAIEAAIEEAVAKGVAEEGAREGPGDAQEARAEAEGQPIQPGQPREPREPGQPGQPTGRGALRQIRRTERARRRRGRSGAGAGGAGADRGRGGPALVGGRSDGTGRSAAQDVARALHASKAEARVARFRQEGDARVAAERRRLSRKGGPRFPWNAGRARRGAGRGARRGRSPRASGEGPRGRGRAGRGQRKGIRRGRGRARRRGGAARRTRNSKEGRPRRRRPEDELAARSCKAPDRRHPGRPRHVQTTKDPGDQPPSKTPGDRETKSIRRRRRRRARRSRSGATLTVPLYAAGIRLGDRTQDLATKTLHTSLGAHRLFCNGRVYDLVDGVVVGLTAHLVQGTPRAAEVIVGLPPRGRRLRTISLAASACYSAAPPAHQNAHGGPPPQQLRQSPSAAAPRLSPSAFISSIIWSSMEKYAFRRHPGPLEQP